MYKNLIKLALIAALVMPTTSALALDVIGPDKPKKNAPVKSDKKATRPVKKQVNKYGKGNAYGFCKKIDNFLSNVWKEDGAETQKTDLENSREADKALAMAKAEDQKIAIAAAAQEMHKAVNAALEQRRKTVVEAAKKAQADCKAKIADKKANAEFIAARKKAQEAFKLTLEAARKEFRTKLSTILANR